jgi:amidase
MTDTATAAELGALDAVGQAELVRRGDVTTVELVESAIARIERCNPELNAVVTPLFDSALDAARAVPNGPLAGVPYLLKDLATEMRGTRFTEGSRFLRDNVSTYDSELVVRLRAAGLVVLGKTNTPEFGMVPACEPLLFGPTRNPWDVTRSTSGSSGGSAAAVAAGMVPAAHANDLGGSIRYPAAACGVFGLKPTRARNPQGPEYGDVVSGWAAEHAVTRTVRDSAALLDATAGAALGDPYCAPPHTAPFATEVGREPGRLHVAYSRHTPDGALGHPDCVAAVESAATLCEQLGHDVVELPFDGLTPDVGGAIGTVFNAATAWIVRYWARHVGREPEHDELEPITRAYYAAGRNVTAADYLLAIEDLQAFSRRVAAFLQSFDVWLTPTMSTPPVALGEIVSTDDEPFRALERGGPTVAYAGVIANITGNPAMSVPLWWNGDGLPIGVHFLGRFGDEATLLRLAAQLEVACPWSHRTPSVTALTPSPTS